MTAEGTVGAPTCLVNKAIDGYGSKSTNSDLAGFYLLLYIRQHAGLFRRRTNVNKASDERGDAPP
jgi:hypothetical protein